MDEASSANTNVVLKTALTGNCTLTLTLTSTEPVHVHAHVHRRRRPKGHRGSVALGHLVPHSDAHVAHVVHIVDILVHAVDAAVDIVVVVVTLSSVASGVVGRRLVMGLDQGFVDGFFLVDERLGNELAFHGKKISSLFFGFSVC